MTGLPKFLRLSSPQKLMLVEAVSAMAFSSLALRFISYRRLMGVLPKASDRSAPLALESAIAVAMRRAARLFGADTCLRQAVAAHIMLARRGYAATIRVGMRLDANGRPLAHAWLTSGERVIVGGSDGDLHLYASFNPAKRSLP